MCATFEIATGIALIVAPDFLVREIFGGGSLSGDIAIVRGAEFGPYYLASYVASWRGY